LDGKPDGKTSLARPRHIWEVSTEIFLELVGWDRLYRIIPSQDRDMSPWLVNTVTELRFS
jgi:hypothetical protein